MEIIIPEGSVEIQTGLWAHLKELILDGEDYSHYNVYSADGYCFYDRNNDLNLDEDGNLKPAEERIYMRISYTPYKTIEELNEDYVSVPIEEGYEIVSVGTNTELA